MLLSRAEVLLCFRKFLLQEAWRTTWDRSGKKPLQCFRWEMMRLRLGQWWWEGDSLQRKDLELRCEGLRKEWDQIPDLVVWFPKTRHEKEEEEVCGEVNESSLGYVRFEGPAEDPRGIDQQLVGRVSLALRKGVWARAPIQEAWALGGRWWRMKAPGRACSEMRGVPRLEPRECPLPLPPRRL